MGKSGNLVRYSFVAFFILCGLAIGIVGSIACTVKYYEGKVPMSDPIASELMATRSEYVSLDDTMLYYNFYDIKKVDDLPYKDLTYLVWLIVIIGLMYVGLGIKIIISKDWIYAREDNAVLEQ